MTVYVDNTRQPAIIGGVYGIWSHLLADSTEELTTFAKQLGLNPSWIQNQGNSEPCP
jgi:hypothetical protein